MENIIFNSFLVKVLISILEAINTFLKINKMYTQIRKESIEELSETLHLSKPQIYKLVNAGLITPYYFKGGFTKPYFDLEEVYSALEPMKGGGVKRRSYCKQNHESA